jgi:gliding motility-associated-like protein
VGNKLDISQTGIFQVNYWVGNDNCSDTSRYNVRVEETPIVSLGKDTSICNALSFTLDANTTVGQYLWNTFETTKQIVVNTTGIYTVHVTQGNCTGKDSIYVIFNVPPVLDLGPDTGICKGKSIKLTATNSNAKYKWNTGSTDSFIYVSKPGMYKVTASNTCGVSSDSMYLNVFNEYCDLFMPNAFTPGNDLINERFTPSGRDITVLNFEIYNRYGELVFKTNKSDEGWDGTYMGQNCEAGVYIWTLHFSTPNGKYITKTNAAGVVHLVR